MMKAIRGVGDALNWESCEPPGSCQKVMSALMWRGPLSVVPLETLSERLVVESGVGQIGSTRSAH